MLVERFRSVFSLNVLHPEIPRHRASGWREWMLIIELICSQFEMISFRFRYGKVFFFLSFCFSFILIGIAFYQSSKCILIKAIFRVYSLRFRFAGFIFLSFFDSFSVRCYSYCRFKH